MFMIFIFVLGSLMLARGISGYDSRYNNRKYFVLKNKKLARLLLSKSVLERRGRVKRSNRDFYKMTYAGMILYICNLLLIISIPILLFVIPEIEVQPLLIETRYSYFVVDTFNENFILLITYILIAVELVVEFIKYLVCSKKDKKYGVFIFSLFMIVVFISFGLLQIKELIYLFLEVF